jgi:hypothetical protein
MANNEIGMRTLNGNNRLEALKVLERLKAREKCMDRELVECIEGGKKTIREHFTPKKQ